MFVNVMTINNIISLSPRSTVKVSLAPSSQCVCVCIHNSCWLEPLISLVFLGTWLRCRVLHSRKTKDDKEKLDGIEEGKKNPTHTATEWGEKQQRSAFPPFVFRRMDDVYSFLAVLVLCKISYNSSKGWNDVVVVGSVPGWQTT